MTQSKVQRRTREHAARNRKAEPLYPAKIRRLPLMTSKNLDRTERELPISSVRDSSYSIAQVLN